MLPTFKPGDNIISFNWNYFFGKPKVGDVVVINIKGKAMIKRIQKINGHLLFVVGDNLQKSTDSRQFGSIDQSRLVGRVVFKL